MKFVIFLIFPLMIALLWKYNSIASETLRQIKLGKEPQIDPMQSALLPEIILFIVLSIISYSIFSFLEKDAKQIVFWGQTVLFLALIPFALKHYLGLKQCKL